MRTTRIRMAGWMGCASVAALLSAAPALAQETVSTAPAASQASPSDVIADNEVDTVIVTGQRAALKSAQQIKRNADTIVDSITASDIGSFPDKSVAEALQRVPGVTVNRYASTSDTTHFSAEPSGVIVRGLSQVRSEFNGRDTFSANSSRGLSWGDVSPELMGGVDTYKNQTAELIEGGIAGTVDLKTRLPFDSAGRVIGITTSLNYGNLSEQVTPEVSAIYANRWDSEIGEFGLMVNGAHSELNTISESSQFGRMGIFKDVTMFGGGTKYIPAWYRLAHTEFDRTRNGVAAAGQWRDNDQKFLATVQFNKSSYENIWHERSVQGSAFSLYNRGPHFEVTNADASTYVLPAPGTTFKFDDEGNFESGIMTSPLGWVGNTTSASNDWAGYLIGQTSTGQPVIEPCYGWTGRTDCAPEQRGGELSATTRYNYNKQTTQDLGFNLKWDATDRLRFNFDVQKVKAKLSNYDADVGLVSYANLNIDATGDHPVMTVLPGTNINYAPGGLANPNAWRFNNVNNHLERSEGDQFAARIDVQYDLGDGWLDSLKVGARHADREQTVRWSVYNWGGIANAWGCDQGGGGVNSTDYLWYNVDRTAPASNVNGDCATGNATTTFSGWDRNLPDVRSFNDIFGGDVLKSGMLTFASMDFVKDLEKFQKAFGYSNTGVGSSRWEAVCYRAGETNCFLPQEITDVSEKTNAAYFMLKFGGRDHTIGGFGISGNIGLRYVETQNESSGSLVHADFGKNDVRVCQPRGRPMGPDGLPITGAYVPQSLWCYLSAEDKAFTDGLASASTVRQKHHNVLPSFNLKIDLNDEWQLRLAASRAMSRPDIGYLKNYVQVNMAGPDMNNVNDPLWVKDSAGNITGANLRYTAESYNPYLKPMTADQIDISLEHYFAEVGSFSLAVFYKKFNDYIQYGGFNQDVTVNGVTRTVFTRGPVNGDGAKIRGAEAAYQRYFDFLPAPFDGLGIQANFTYVENKGITNSNLSNASGGGGSNTSGGGLSQADGAVQVDSLEGLSKYAYNLVGMYEKGRWAVRAAYNWRSKYLLTAMDCCLAFPIWQDDAGYLDASVRYRASDNLEISLQGSNLLNTESVLKQQVTDASAGGLLKDNAWNRTDKRYLLTFRFKY